MLDNLKSIVPNHAPAFDLIRTNDDKADMDKDNSADPILRRTKASRIFRIRSYQWDR